MSQTDPAAPEEMEFRHEAAFFRQAEIFRDLLPDVIDQAFQVHAPVLGEKPIVDLCIVASVDEEANGINGRFCYAFNFRLVRLLIYLFSGKNASGQKSHRFSLTLQHDESRLSLPYIAVARRRGADAGGVDFPGGEARAVRLSAGGLHVAQFLSLPEHAPDRHGSLLSAAG